MNLNFKQDNGPVDRLIEDLIRKAGGIPRPRIIRELILASLKAGQEDDGGVDLKMMNTSVKEMRYTAKIFGQYRSVKKVTVFGSARTRPEETIFKMARELGRELAESGYHVITGGGPGIMQAIHEGAGPDFSFGVNIYLPFEQKVSPVMLGSPRSIIYKYFFNRKVAFLKESDAVVVFPGGFGTQDEAMETLTLVQTGKRNPLPLILMDEPGGTYWTEWVNYIETELLGRGYISRSDLHLFDRSDGIDDAVGRINRFYHRYHSLRYIGTKLVLRLTSPIDKARIDDLTTRFSDILTPGGGIILTEAFAEEENEENIRRLPRLAVDFTRNRFGRLKQLIDAVNED